MGINKPGLQGISAAQSEGGHGSRDLAWKGWRGKGWEEKPLS